MLILIMNIHYALKRQMKKATILRAEMKNINSPIIFLLDLLSLKISRT
jgi:hypothetical protein